MTYYELLLKVSFDEIAPFLSNSYTEGKPLAPFKMHYDYLRHLVPQQNEHNDKIIVYLIPPAADRPRITIAAFLEKNPLEESLGREVVVVDNADIPLAEIAACCIYTSSLSTFLPNWNDMWRHLPLYCYDTEYGTGKVFKHCKETYSKLIPSKKEMMNIRSFRNAIRSEMKQHRIRHNFNLYKYLFHNMFWRRWKRLTINKEYKWRIIMNAEFIDDLYERGKNLTEPPTAEQLSVLFRANECWIDRWQTCAFDAGERCAYLKELKDKYDLAKALNQQQNSIICISTSPKYPLQPKEMATLRQVLSISVSEPLFCLKADNALEEDLRIDFAFYSM